MTVGVPARFGITGHQSLSPATQELVLHAFRARLSELDQLVGVTSLAGGADQLFARVVLEVGGNIHVVIPSTNYYSSFSTNDDRERFREFLALAVDSITLPYPSPTEQAYWAAGKEIVKRSDRMLAVWDGEPAAGLGGTADVVEYARAQGKDVDVIWPPGAARD